MEFEQWFRNNKWEGEAGKVPKSQELVSALGRHDLFIYVGHGSGLQYVSGKDIMKGVDLCAAALLMGCSSGALKGQGCYAPEGAAIYYLLAGSPAVIANLWEVTDRDNDRFLKCLISSLLQEEETSVRPENCTHCNNPTQDFGCLEIGDSRSSARSSTRRKVVTHKKKLPQVSKGPCEVCGRKRIASFMHEARNACKLPYLIGASGVCYGVPTVILKKSS